MSLTLLLIGLLVFVLGLPWLAVAVAMFVWGLRALGSALYGLLMQTPRAPQPPLP